MNQEVSNSNKWPSKGSNGWRVVDGREPTINTLNPLEYEWELLDERCFFVIWGYF